MTELLVLLLSVIYMLALMCVGYALWRAPNKMPFIALGIALGLSLLGLWIEKALNLI